MYQKRKEGLRPSQTGHQSHGGLVASRVDVISDLGVACKLRIQIQIHWSFDSTPVSY